MRVGKIWTRRGIGDLVVDHCLTFEVSDAFDTGSVSLFLRRFLSLFSFGSRFHLFGCSTCRSFDNQARVFRRIRFSSSHSMSRRHERIKSNVFGMRQQVELPCCVSTPRCQSSFPHSKFMYMHSEVAHAAYRSPSLLLSLCIVFPSGCISIKFLVFGHTVLQVFVSQTRSALFKLSSACFVFFDPLI